MVARSTPDRTVVGSIPAGLKKFYHFSTLYSFITTLEEILALKHSKRTPVAPKTERWCDAGKGYL